MYTVGLHRSCISQKRIDSISQSLNTPGLQNESTQNKTVNGISDQGCVHVIVPGIAQAMMKNGNIYFPRNGAQPTTPEAAEYSCANVNSDHITDWYVRAFGGDAGVELSYKRPAPARDLAPQMGFNVHGAPSHVITVNTTTSSTPKKFAEEFWYTFRAIASNPVGRILLYRILIEIRRTFNGKPDTFTYKYEGAQEERNQCCSIQVINGKPSFSYTCGCLAFDTNTYIGTIIGHIISKDTQRIFSTEVEQNIINNHIGHYAIIPEKACKPLDVTLFHEFGHWFHFLKNQKRYHKESDWRKKLLDSEIGKHFWSGLSVDESDERDKITGAQWSATIHGPACIEEIRNILGMPPESKNFENGDELSENEYRRNKGLPLRFGHRNIGFIEDAKVIRKILTSYGYCNTLDIGGNLLEFKAGLGKCLGLE